MIDIKTMYQDLWNALDGICDRTYLRSRPKSVDTAVGSYIVIELPYSIKNAEIDFEGTYNDYVTTAQIGIYVRDKISASKPNGFDVCAMDEKVKAVLGKFPIASDNILATRPRVTMQGDDGDGFGITIIQGRLRTR